jgi:tRNA-specific 2-thiouridylase
LPRTKPTIFLGFSGGVDSAVAAILLQKDFSVLGIFFEFWREKKITDFFRNFQQKNRVKKLAAAVGIPIEFFPARQIFSQKVVGKFLTEFAAGRTPNPCVFCNRDVKIELLAKIAATEKNAKFATGHFAQTVSGKLFRGLDLEKDQSLFLCRVAKKNLKNLVLPLGKFSKKKVWEIAAAANLTKFLPKSESRDLCFLRGKLSRFLQKNLPEKFFTPGNFIDSSGEVLGTHRGILNFTVGQRARLSGQNEALFVGGIDLEKNEVKLISPAELFVRQIFLRSCQFFRRPRDGAEVFVQTRHRGGLHRGKIHFGENKKMAKIIFEGPVRRTAPGQIVAIFSEKNEVVGSGIFC